MQKLLPTEVVHEYTADLFQQLLFIVITRVGLSACRWALQLFKHVSLWYMKETVLAILYRTAALPRSICPKTRRARTACSFREQRDLRCGQHQQLYTGLKDELIDQKSRGHGSPLFPCSAVFEQALRCSEQGVQEDHAPRGASIFS